MTILKLTNAHDGEPVYVFTKHIWLVREPIADDPDCPPDAKAMILFRRGPVYVRETVATVLNGIPGWNEVFPKADDVSRET